MSGRNRRNAQALLREVFFARDFCRIQENLPRCGSESLLLQFKSVMAKPPEAIETSNEVVNASADGKQTGAIKEAGLEQQSVLLQGG